MALSLNEKVMFFTKYLSLLLWSLSRSNTNHAVKNSRLIQMLSYCWKGKWQLSLSLILIFLIRDSLSLIH